MDLKDYIIQSEDQTVRELADCYNKQFEKDVSLAEIRLGLHRHSPSNVDTTVWALARMVVLVACKLRGHVKLADVCGVCGEASE